MTRLASIGPRAIHQPFTKSIYDQLQASTDWDYVGGAALAALTGGNTLNVTSRHHKVTIVGGTIDNIADAAGASEGQLLELYFTGATTIRNNGGGAGNIRSISGQDLAVAANDVVELVFDGANWRECARANVNLPTAGKVVWGSLADAQIGRIAAGIIGDPNTDYSTGPTSSSVAQGTEGALVDKFFASWRSSLSFAGLAIAATTDTQWRLLVGADGSLKWSPGSGSSDVTLSRIGSGELALGGTSQGNALRIFQSATGNFYLRGFIAAEANPRFGIQGDGTVNWGPGGATAPDTTLARSAVATLTMNGTFIQNKSLEAAPATVNVGAGGTFTPTHTNGLVQRVNCTGAGTVTIASPGVPAAGTSSLLFIIVHNASGGTVTLSWNAIYNQPQAGPLNGQGIVTLWLYNPGTSKWTLVEQPPAVE